MTATWRHLPAAARAIATAADDAVAAAQRRDPDGYTDAVAALASADRSGLVLGTVVRLLLEQIHPDGLDGDDVRRLLEECVREVRDWYPAVDPHVLLVLLAGALGVYDPDDDPSPPDAAAVAAHAPLLLADLLTVTGRPFGEYLTAAFADISRAEQYD